MSTVNLVRFISNAKQHCRRGFDKAQALDVHQQARAAERAQRGQQTHHPITAPMAHCQTLQAREQNWHSMHRRLSESPARTSKAAFVAGLTGSRHP